MADETTEKKAAPARATADKRTVVQRMLDIAAEVGVLEPSKSGGVPFAFRGVDATVAHLAPLLNKHGVIVMPTDVSHITTQREVGSKVVTKAEVEVTYTFYGATGDSISVKVPGQADDFADRSTAQAMSVAFRIALLQTFHIPAFGNEEQFSEDTKSNREAAAAEAVSRAKGASAPAGKKPGLNPAEGMRRAILAAAKNKSMEGAELNEFAEKVTGKGTDDWWDDPDELNKILVAIQGG